MKQRYQCLIGLILCINLSISCASANVIGQNQPILPPNTESEYLKTLYVGTAMGRGEAGSAEMLYKIRLKIIKSLPENSLLVFAFENPDTQAAPLEVIYEPQLGQDEIFLSVPIAPCIVNNRYYRAVITLFSDRKRQHILGSHEQMIAFFNLPVFLTTLRVPECLADRQGGSKFLDKQLVMESLRQLESMSSPFWSIEFPKHELWEAHPQRDGGREMIEYTTGGEKLESLISWSQLLTFEYFPFPQEKFQDGIKRFLTMQETHCSSYKRQMLYQSENQVTFRWATESCDGLPPQEEVIRYEYKDFGIYVIKFTYYKQKAKPDFEAWIRRVMEAKIIR